MSRVLISPKPVDKSGNRIPGVSFSVHADGAWYTGGVGNYAIPSTPAVPAALELFDSVTSTTAATSFISDALGNVSPMYVEIIDSAAQLVLVGIVDSSVHMEPLFNTSASDDSILWEATPTTPYVVSTGVAGSLVGGSIKIGSDGVTYMANSDEAKRIATGNTAAEVDTSVDPSDDSVNDGTSCADWVAVVQELTADLIAEGDWLDASYNSLSTTDKTFFDETATGIEITSTAGTWAGAGRLYKAPDGAGKYRIQAQYELLSGRAQVGYRLYNNGVVVQHPTATSVDVFDTYNVNGRDNHLTELVAGVHAIDTVIDLFNAPQFDGIVFSIRSSNGSGGAYINFNPHSVRILKEESIYDRYPEGYSLSKLGVVIDDLNTDSAPAINDFSDHLLERQELILNQGVGAYTYIKQGNIRFDTAIDCSAPRVTMDFANAEIEANSDLSFNLGVDGQDRSNNRTIQGGRWFVNTDSSVFFSAKNATLFKLQEMDINLRGKDQVGIKMEGNVSPPSPYYNLIRDVRLAGSADATDNQIGIQMLYSTDADAVGEFGANRCNIRGMPKLSSMSIGLDCQAATGGLYGGIDFESCYDYAAIFGRNATTIEGTITTTNDSGVQAIDANLVDDGTFLNGAIEFLTGANAGHTSGMNRTSTTSSIFLRRGTPYPITIGDTFKLTSNRVTGISLTEATVESAGTAIHFAAGATNVKCELAFRTQDTASKWFEREIEDTSNTIARRTTEIVFEGTVTANDSVFLEPVDISSIRGGAFLLESGWVDSLTVTSSTRAFNGLGEIDVNVFSSGLVQPLATKLTPTAYNRASAVTKTLVNADLIKIGQLLKIKATASSDLATSEVLRAVLSIGHL